MSNSIRIYMFLWKPFCHVILKNEMITIIKKIQSNSSN